MPPAGPGLPQRFDPSPQELDVWSPTRVELDVEADVEAGSPHDVGHEGIAGDEPAARERGGERTQVDDVARLGATLGEVALEQGCEAQPEALLERPRGIREPPAAGKSAKQLE